MREKRRRPNELASGCKTLARKLRCGTSPVAPWFLGVADEESYPRRADRPRGRGPTYNPFVGGNRSQSTASGTQAAHQGRESVLKSTIIAAPKRPRFKRCGDHWKIIHSLLTGCQKDRQDAAAAAAPPPQGRRGIRHTTDKKRRAGLAAHHGGRRRGSVYTEYH